MSTGDVRERDLPRMREIVASLRPVGAALPVQRGAPSVDGAASVTGALNPPGPGVPWLALALLRDLLDVDECDLHGMDAVGRRHFLVQDLDSEGPMEYLVDEPGSPRIDFLAAHVTGTNQECDAPEAAFWDLYWTSSCSLLDRTGDWTAVIGSEYQGRQEAAEWSARMGYPLMHHLCTAAPVGRSRQVRLLAWREGWGDFGERERGYLELLKPHFVDAWRRSHVTGPRLTDGQRRVLRLVRDGYTNRQVARDLGISEATVRTHLQHAYTILGVNNRVAAVAAAFGTADAGV